MTAADACLRCGDFSDPSSRPVSSVPLCARCLSNGRQTFSLSLILPPRHLHFRRFWSAYLAALVFAPVGPWLGWEGLMAFSIGLRYVELVIVLALLSVVTSLLGVLGVMTFSDRAYHHATNEAWLDHEVTQLGLGALRGREGLSVELAMFASARLRYFMTKRPCVIGVLITAPEGWVFLASNGVRLAIPLSAVVACGEERLKVLPHRRFLVLELVKDAQALGPGPYCFAWMSEPSFAANNERVSLMRRRLQDLIGARRAG